MSFPQVSTDSIILAFTNSNGVPQRFPLEPGRGVFVGSAKNCGVQLCGNDISPIHCRITCDGHTIRIHDWMSASGTLLDSVRIEGEVEAYPGSVLQLGSQTLRLTLAGGTGDIDEFEDGCGLRKKPHSCEQDVFSPTSDNSSGSLDDNRTVVNCSPSDLDPTNPFGQDLTESFESDENPPWEIESQKIEAQKVEQQEVEPQEIEERAVEAPAETQKKTHDDIIHTTQSQIEQFSVIRQKSQSSVLHQPDRLSSECIDSEFSKEVESRKEVSSEWSSAAFTSDAWSDDPMMANWEQESAQELTNRQSNDSWNSSGQHGGTSAMESRIRDLLEEAELSDQRIAALEDQLLAAESAQAAQNEERQCLEAWLQDIECKFSSREEEHTAEVEQLKSTLVERQNELQQLHQRLELIASSSDASHEILPALEQLRSNNLQLQEQLDTAHGRCRELEQKVATVAEQQAEVVRSELAELARERAELARQRHELVNQLSQVSAIPKQASSEESEMAYRLRALRQHLREIHAQEQQYRPEATFATRLTNLWHRITQ